MLGTSASPNTLSNKKRKHMSPSPGETRSPKVIKVPRREMSAEKKVGDERLGGEKESTRENDVEIACESFGKDSKSDGGGKEASSKETKVDGKGETKVGDITRFLVKVKTTRKKEPKVILTRCDAAENVDKNSAQTCTTSQNKKQEEKFQASKSDESSNEELAKELDNSEDEIIKSDSSSDDNSDLDSVGDISSSDVDTDERKLNKENESIDDKKNLHGTSFDKTPTCGVKSDEKNNARRKLTPKQLEKKMESTKRREEQRMRKLVNIQAFNSFLHSSSSHNFNTNKIIELIKRDMSILFNLEIQNFFNLYLIEMIKFLRFR